MTGDIFLFISCRGTLGDKPATVATLSECALSRGAPIRNAVVAGVGRHTQRWATIINRTRLFSWAFFLSKGALTE
jgi:hypothetical protein